MSSRNLVSVDFEVFGRVQGVFFRKNTQDTAQKHGLVGWVENTRHGTVVGTVQGPADKIDFMKRWLCETGSPRSKIEKCDFDNETDIPEYSFQTFEVRRPSKSKKKKAKK